MRKIRNAIKNVMDEIESKSKSKTRQNNKKQPIKEVGDSLLDSDSDEQDSNSIKYKWSGVIYIN